MESSTAPEPVYEERRVLVGWRHVCEYPECPRKGEPFVSKQRSRFCSRRCRSRDYAEGNRQARRIVDELGIDLRTGQKADSA